MKNNFFLLILLVAAAGCHKDPPVVQGCVMESASFEGITSYFTYDAQNRISEVTTPSIKVGYSTENYHYGSNGLVDKVTYLDSVGNTEGYRSFFYNSAGQILADCSYVTSSTLVDSYNLYICNAAGQVVEGYTYDDTTSATSNPYYAINVHNYYSYDANGNIIKLRDYYYQYLNNVVTISEGISYLTYDNSPNVSKNLVSNGLLYFVLNKNNIVTMKDSASADLEFSTYTYNTSNYVTKRVTIFKDGNSADSDTTTTTFSYLCH